MNPEKVISSKVIRFPIKQTENNESIDSDRFMVQSSKMLYNTTKSTSAEADQGDDLMDWQEKYIEKVDQSISEIKQGLRDTENRISEMINKHIEYNTHLDEERHSEILKVNEKLDQSIESINNKIDGANKWIIGLVITAMTAIAAMVLSILLS